MTEAKPEPMTISHSRGLANVLSSRPRCRRKRLNSRSTTAARASCMRDLGGRAAATAGQLDEDVLERRAPGSHGANARSPEQWKDLRERTLGALDRNDE